MYSGIIYQYRINNKYYVGKTFGLERKRIDKHKYEALTLRKPVRCLETGETFDSVYDAAKSVYGSNAHKKKCIIQASIKHGWAASGKHYEYIEHDDPVLSETEV